MMRGRIRSDRARWIDSGQSPELLLPKGIRLEEGRQLLADHGDVLIGEVVDYIQLSLERQTQLDEEEREREQAFERARTAAAEERAQAAAAVAAEQRRTAFRTRIFASAAVGLAVVASLAGRHAWVQKLEAEQQRRTALSRHLAAQALDALDDRLDLALLLGVQASALAETAEARSALLSALAHRLHLSSFLDGHTRSLRRVSFSPDGNTLASECADGTIILWDLATRRPVGDPLRGSYSFDMAFSPDGKLGASLEQNSIILWDLAKRSRLQTTINARPQPQPQEPSPVDQDAYRRQLEDWAHSQTESMAFSPDGKVLALGGGNGSITLWDIANNRQSGAPLKGQAARISHVLFSPDGKALGVVR